MDGHSLPGIATGLSATAAFGFLAWSLIKRNAEPRLPLPPGPRPLPLIGNILDVPREKQWLVHQQWAQQYGDIVHLKVPGQHIIVLNSLKAANDLFERRGNIYSSRPGTVMLNELMGFGEWDMVVRPYGEIWRRERRMFHSQTHQNAAPKFKNVQMRQARLFMKKLAADPSDLAVSVRAVVSATIMDVVYGVQVDGDHRYVYLAEKVVDLFSDGCQPGAFLVDFIPLLRYIPSWVPGAGFQRIAEFTRRLSEEMQEEPIQEVERAMAAGDVKISMTSELLEEARAKGELKERREIIKGVTGLAYAAGADTTTSTLHTFFLAMANYPEVQAKAQAEIDSVVGQDRLPEFSDRANLPYIHAVISELLRWQSVLPLGLPHLSTADDEYDGYFIPKGTVVIGNIWSMLHDPQEYPEPEIFRPERHLKTMPDGSYVPNKGVRDPRTIVFGFGRRVCPGRHIADQSIFATITSVLSVFTIATPVDEQGNLLPCKIEMGSGLISHPASFNCIIKPRSQRAVELIDQPLPERGL